MPRKRRDPDESAVRLSAAREPRQLVQALRELDGWRARWANVPELEGLMLDLTRLDRHVRLLDALQYAQQLEAEGYPRPEAAQRAATMFRQPREELLALLRAS